MKYLLTILTLVLSITLLPVKDIQAGLGGNTPFTFNSTDSSSPELATIVYMFDLRERETFIQLTYPDQQQVGLSIRAHVQIFNVANNCNENNFFDIYTVNDTHVYNMRDIVTNDGNPSGVVLPDGAYGLVVVTAEYSPFVPADPDIIGNLRIIDNNGYEYRTNAQSFAGFRSDELSPSDFYSFNFNQQGGVSFSDVVGITLFVVEGTNSGIEFTALPVQGIFTPIDIDIYNLNEVPFSCRDVIFSCVDEDNPLLEELLSIAEIASVASFEYGINNSIPHSKGGELLCPNNTVEDGIVILRSEPLPSSQAFDEIINSINGMGPFFHGYVGLNNGNGRGSMDSFWIYFEEDFIL